MACPFTLRILPERKKAEEEIKTLNAELEKRVTVRTEELRKANEELEAFSYSVSHDLRAPLRAIIGFTAILEEDYTNSLDEEAKRITAVIKSNTLKMGQLIDDLLSFSRLGRQNIKKATINSNETIQTILEELKEADNRQSIKWIIHPLPPVNGDVNTLRQVWVNLISNAIKYSGKDRIPCDRNRVI